MLDGHSTSEIEAAALSGSLVPTLCVGTQAFDAPRLVISFRWNHVV